MVNQGNITGIKFVGHMRRNFGKDKFANEKES